MKKRNIDEYILKNYKEKTNAQMALELGCSKSTISNLIVDNTIIINTAINIKKVKTNGICKSPSLYY